MGNEALTVLGPEDCWTLLTGEEVGRLAVAVAGQPDIFPLNHLAASAPPMPVPGVPLPDGPADAPVRIAVAAGAAFTFVPLPEWADKSSLIVGALRPI